MKILTLALKKQWYEMIESGIKTEEYREIKPYWEKRLIDYKRLKEVYRQNREELLFELFHFPHRPVIENIMEVFKRGYTHVKFSYGYTKRTMTFELNEITIGKGKAEWGAEYGKPYFIIKLGKRI